MSNRELANLRRARSRCHFTLKQLEMPIESYAFRLAEIEAGIMELAPELELPPRFRQPNPVIARGDRPRLALDHPAGSG